MRYRLAFRPAAKADLEALYDYIADSAGDQRAGTFIARIERACLALTTFPERGTVRNDIHPGLRIIGFERRTAIAFKVEGDLVRIMRVLHGGRELPVQWVDLGDDVADDGVS